MIYFQHWGNEQTRLRKTLHGLQKTDKIFRCYFHKGLVQRDRDMTTLSFWKDLVQVLLPLTMTHYEPYDMSRDHLRLLSLRNRFYHSIKSSATSYNSSISNATEDQMRRIHAIVALPVQKSLKIGLRTCSNNCHDGEVIGSGECV